MGLTWSWLAFAATEPYWASRAWITVLVLVGTGLTAVMSVAFFALAMGLSWPKVAATQFTAYMALSNYSSVLGYRWSGAFDLYFGITRSFVVCAFIGCLSVLILQGIDPGQARRELGDA